MKQWLISKIPTWILKILVWRNYNFRQKGLVPDQWYWADIELAIRGDKIGFVHKYKERLIISGPKKPVGIPEYLGKEHKPYDSITYKGVPFYYQPCFCNHSIGENCEECKP